MNNFSIRFVDYEITPALERVLDEVGLVLWSPAMEKPWLTVINLSECDVKGLKARFAKNPSQNWLALLAPEQGELAAAAMQAGAQDYLLLPLESAQFKMTLERLHRLESADTHLIAVDKASKQLLMLAHRAAMTEATVLLTGESGTGKEPLAHYIHRYSTRAKQQFVAINCAAIPETMLESILFGHSKGAFTGANTDRVGSFEQANGGTLLLDEVAEMPLVLQAKLLRVLQERRVQRLGSNQMIDLDIRVIAATNKDLRSEVDQGRFREDLFYRLDVLPLNISPLRERKVDILPLASHFLNLYTHDHEHCLFSKQASNHLVNYNWPGNVRELENCIQRALVMRRGQTIQLVDLGLVDVSAPAVSPVDLKASKRQAEFQFIADTLCRLKGNRNDTAAELGMTTRGLRYKLTQMREAGIDIEQLLQQQGNAA